MKNFRSRRKILVAIGVIVLAVLMVVTFTMKDVKKVDKPLTQSEPSAVDVQGRIHVTPNAPKNAVKVEFVFDPMCPGCRAVDQTLKPTIDRLIDEGRIDLWLTPISFLDRASSDGYSTRAVNSIYIVNEREPEKVRGYVDALFRDQPAEGPGYVPVTVDDLKKTAVKSGVSEKVANEFSDISFEQWIAGHTASTAQRKDLFPKQLTTPTVAVTAGKGSPVVVDFGQGDDIEGAFNRTFEKIEKTKSVTKENRR